LKLRQALDLQGGKDACGKLEILYRAAAAAYLNIVSGCVQYPISTVIALKNEVNAAALNCDPDAIIAEATRLDGFNNSGCPIDQQGVCSNARLDPPGPGFDALREYIDLLRPVFSISLW